MFSPARGKLGKAKGGGLHSPAPASPAVIPQLSPLQPTPGPLRGTLSPLFPWSSGSSIPPRTPPSTEIGDVDGREPVFVCNFPQQLRNSFAERPQQRSDAGIYGGMDGRSGLSWVLHANTLFVWSHLNSRAAQRCAVLTIPAQFSGRDGRVGDSKFSENWLVSIVGWGIDDQNDVSFVKACKSAGVIMCHRKSLAVLYWPDVFKDGDTSVVSLGPGDKFEGSSTPAVEENRLSGRRSFSSWTGSTGGPGGELVNSLIASAVPGKTPQSCVVIAGRSNGELWRYDSCPLGITRQQIIRDVVARQEVGLIAFNSSSARSMVWRFPADNPEQGVRQLLLLTASELECWNVELLPGGKVTGAWRFNILGNPETQKDLAGQKQVWLLDLQVDDSGNFFTVLVASFSKDRVNSSSFMQYSLLTFFDNSPPNGVVVRKAPMQVILPKARVEEEDVLYSMRLRIGGKPMGSAVILAGDGTSTIAHYSNGSLKLYQFDLAWGAGKVLDASVVPALEGDEGAWLVLTEKSGVWAVPEKAVILGGVEPPERSLSRRGSSIEDSSSKEERQRNWSIQPRRVVSETGAMDSRLPRTLNQRPLHDEEAEAIVGRMFQQYLTTGRVDSALEKLERAGAFEREVEMNIFARTSRVIVDTLAKHWVAGGAGSAAIMAAVSSQLIEKQRRHQQYLNFLSISNCHEQLQLKQRGALHAIMEHGEKLAAMVQLRELHNSRAQARLQNSGGSFNEPEPLENIEASGALWDTVQLVGEKARRNNVMLMDREKSEVFYTRVSDLEEFFACIQQHASSIIGQEQPVRIQVERICEIAEATTGVIRAAIRYRDAQSSWYPSPEGMTPWYCRPTVRSGVWKVGSLILEVKAEAHLSVPSRVPKLVSWLEVVADVLLEGYAGAITAKVEREEEYRGLQMEYWSRRDTLLSALQRHAKEVADESVQSIHDEDKATQQRRAVLQKMYPSLIAIARRHAGYQTLYNICTDLNDMNQLRNLMRESMGLREGRFSHYVFEQLCRTKQYSKLLLFGEEFQEELEAYLQDHIHLRWLHELLMQQYTSACSTLHTLALTPSWDEETTVGKVVRGPNVKDKLRDRRRLLYLAKVAALAGGDMGGGDKLAKIDANIVIIEVQEEAHQKDVVSDEILLPVQLIEACLKSGHRELVMRAFDVFAYAGDSFRKSNKSLLESAWLHAADQDNWASMKDISEETGWSDEQYWLALQGTVLCHMAKRCYGEGAAYYGAPFQEILPLFESDRTEDDKRRISKSEPAPKTVESILMQQGDFSDAREAMLTALRMGVSSENDLEEKELELELESMVDS